MDIDIIIECDAWKAYPLVDWAHSAVVAVAGHMGLDDTHSLALLACDNARIATLNADFRGKPQPTNVLSWPSNTFSADAPHSPTDPELGDMAIALETCVTQAKDQNKSVQAHVTHLLVHGTLHLLGYDHVNDADAAIMENLEIEILAKLSISNPYFIQD